MSDDENEYRRDYRRERKSSRNSGSGIGLALWVVAAIILFILFLVNQGKIVSNLKQTGFFGRVFGKTPAFVENAPDKLPADKNQVEPVSGGASASGLTITHGSASKDSPSSSALINPSYGATDAALSGENTTDDTSSAVAAADVANLGRTMDIKLYFMSITSDGSVVRTEVVRSMPKSGSPLYDAINALIAGPDMDEDAKGCRTLISTGTRLLGASVNGGVATLNFSGEFEFNQYGIEGTRGQLQQIVFTATAFPTVESVQFLVDGEKRDYLGSEGVWIGTPLGRNNF